MSAVDVDLRGIQDFTANPYPYYAKMRAEGPVHTIRTDDFERVWLIVGYEEGRAALADQRLGKDWRTTQYATGAGDPINANMLEMDAPHHTRLRRLVAREFTARRIESLRPRVQQITDELLDAMVPVGHGDLVDALAFPLPMTVICELIGVPDLDRNEFRRLSNGIVTPKTAQEEGEAVRSMGAYLVELIEDKRCSPGDDLLSALIRARDEEGDGLSSDELVGMAFLLLVAGHETTVNLISNGVRALLAHPDQLAALRADFGLIDGAVEEMLRYDGPVETATFRFTREPVGIGSRVVPAGEAVLIALAGADRDPARYPEPDRFDIRRDTQGHLAFGHGIHFCMGAPLARMEGRIAIRALLERCPDLELAPETGELDWLPGMLIRGCDGCRCAGEVGRRVMTGLDLQMAQKVLDSQPFSRLVGARITAFGDGSATLEVDIRPELQQQNGFVHGGVLSYAADNSITFAAGTTLGPAVLTGGFSIQYIRPVGGRTLIARSVVVHTGRRQAVVRCDLFAVADDGTETLCAVAQGTVLPARN